MARRMYSESQLNKIIDSKLEGYDASIPTDLAASGDVLKLEHDTTPLGEGIHFKQLFGNYTIFGEGNIDLYKHWIVLTGATGNVCFFMFPSSMSIIADSVQDLDTLITTTTKTIGCSGTLKKEDGTLLPIQGLIWEGKFATSRFYMSDGTYITTAASGLTRVRDALETL